MAAKSKKAGRPKTADPASARRILDAAERLIAESGYNGASIRAIAAAAGANLSSVYYHFKSKRGLLDAVCRRRLQPIVDARNADMRALGARGRTDIEALVTAFVGSSIRQSLATTPEAKIFRRLVGHLGTDPSAQVRAAIGRVYNESVGEFVAALRAALPRRRDEALFWATACSLGATLYTQGDLTRLQSIMGLPQRPADAAASIRCISRFIAGGLRAPRG